MESLTLPPIEAVAAKSGKTVKHVPTSETRAIVKAASAVGLPHDCICALVGIRSVNTLKLRYKTELSTGRALAGYKVAKTAFELATKDRDAGMVRYWLSRVMGWKEPVSPVEVYTPPGQALHVVPGEDSLAAYHRAQEMAARSAIQGSVRTLAGNGAQAQDPGDAGPSEE